MSEQCAICGRFCRLERDAWSDPYWRCTKMSYDNQTEQWEHE